MGQRLELQTLLETVLGSENVYFQPPSNVLMKYPSIVYNLEDMSTEFASNNPYVHTRRYQVTVIDRNPDSVIPGKIAALPMCLMNRYFSANNLHHSVFTLYF